MDEMLDQSLNQDSENIRFLSAKMGLTTRQAEVLHWVAQGKTNEEIATILKCSFHTVKTHLKEIFHRLSVPNRAAAIAAVYRVFIDLLKQNAASTERGMPTPQANR
jgi:DNA-binding CsgD family transcriptional regulator